MWFWIIFWIAVGVTTLAMLFAWSLCKAASDADDALADLPIERPAPVSPSGRPMAVCVECGRLVVVRKGDGLPYAARHRCHVPGPAAVADEPQEAA
jgi:hypothetical protein